MTQSSTPTAAEPPTDPVQQRMDDAARRLFAIPEVQAILRQNMRRPAEDDVADRA